mmetsp:Transcript_19706/g.46074  ORF Transcript_19706/g.46074 Transcript_19706/m.46074 type:complete len:224 (-) Transcript_19706:493-1164(-)
MRRTAEPPSMTSWLPSLPISSSRRRPPTPCSLLTLTLTPMLRPTTRPRPASLLARILSTRRALMLSMAPRPRTPPLSALSSAPESSARLRLFPVVARPPSLRSTRMRMRTWRPARPLLPATPLTTTALFTLMRSWAWIFRIPALSRRRSSRLSPVRSLASLPALALLTRRRPPPPLRRSSRLRRAPSLWRRATRRPRTPCSASSSTAPRLTSTSRTSPLTLTP